MDTYLSSYDVAPKPDPFCSAFLFERFADF